MDTPNPKFRVLALDDNQMNLDVLTLALQEIELDVCAFTDPLEALGKCREKPFDLFILDIEMPLMSGFEFAQKITAFHEIKPIVFLSAHNEPEYKVQSYSMGAYAYIEKPFDIPVLQAQIEGLLNIKRKFDSDIKAKDDYLAMVVHDLKSPIAAETLALKQLSTMTNREESNELINDILDTVKYKKNLVDNILNKYKFDNGTLSLKKDVFCVKTLIEECIAESKFLFEDKILNLDLCSMKVCGDPFEIKRVLLNLLINAAEHTRRGARVDIQCVCEDAMITVSVKNECDGIAAADPNDIFKSNFSSKQKRGGTGLGLYVSKQIIEAHGGSIFAWSKPLEFAQITFSIPGVG
jgi:signal transduction histidine kinase